MTSADAQRADRLRRAILTSIPNPPAEFDEVDPKNIYVPPHHQRSLDPDSMLVTGIRGAGKSFWWFALQDDTSRKAILRRDTSVTLGFGQKSVAEYPDRDELIQLLGAGITPRLIWRTVLVRQISAPARTWRNWGECAGWVVANPSSVAGILRDRDSELAAAGRTHLVLFDALDRTADLRSQREELLSGLLQLVLELRSFRAIRAKVFARPDMLETPHVRAFPDASKVLASSVSLDWTTQDLYGLLFQYLGNAADPDAAAEFRSLVEGGARPKKPAGGVWRVPEPLREDAKQQQKIFDEVAGPYMGSNARRGRTYTWVPNHLADGRDAVSPRSFLAAVRRAADEPPRHRHALHWSGLHEGVRHASTIRADEIREDVPWAHDAMSLLKDLLVPCTKTALLNAWGQAELLNKGIQGLPPDYKAVLEELQRTGILKVLPDQRINIPDVYRLGFGLRRKGGFAPRLL